MTQADSPLRESPKSKTPELLVISSCTASKVRTPGQGPVFAEDLYAGQQHVRLMRGGRAYRAAGEPLGGLRFAIVSALHGVISPARSITAYDFTFTGMSSQRVVEHAWSLGIPSAISRLLRSPYRLGLLLLSEPYIKASALSEGLRLGGPLLTFCSSRVAQRLPRLAGLRPIALANREAKQFSCGLTSLKGELGGRILSGLATGQLALEQLTDPGADVLEALDRLGQQSGLRMAA